MMAESLDPTFRSYSAQQAGAYARHRGSYASPIIQEVINYHSSLGGAFCMVLDVGCGTGNATRQLATYFDRAVGCDAGEEMIAQARREGGQTNKGSAIAYDVIESEKLSESNILTEGSVDLLTVAMAVKSSFFFAPYPGS